MQASLRNIGTMTMAALQSFHEELNGPKGGAQHDGYMVCRCSVAREIQRRIKLEINEAVHTASSIRIKREKWIDVSAKILVADVTRPVFVRGASIRDISPDQIAVTLILERR